jgi:hypothetical protein
MLEKMNPRKQLEELATWTKQTGHWLNKNQPRLARVTEPIMARASLDLGYLMTAHEFVEATQPPPIIKTAMYLAAGVGLPKWNEIVVKEVNRALNEYNSRQESGDVFNWLRMAVLTGTTSLAISTALTYFDSNSQGTPFSSEQKVEYVEQNLVQEPVDEAFAEIILEPTEGNLFTETSLPDLDFNQTGLDLTDLVRENIPQIHLEDFKELKIELEQTFSRQQIIDKELHPRAQAHYDTISQGYNKKATIKKFVKAREHDELFKAAADRYEIPYTMMFSLAINESAGEVDAKSYAGARGLMQITPRTGKYIAKKMGKKFSNLTGRSTFQTADLYNPKINIEMGAFYLRFIHDHYGERIMKKRGEMPNDYKEWTEKDLWDFTMACYNRGPSGMTNSMIKFGADTFWDLKKNQTTDEARRYVPKIDGINKLYNEYLMEQAGMSDEIAKVIH